MNTKRVHLTPAAVAAFVISLILCFGAIGVGSAYAVSQAEVDAAKAELDKATKAAEDAAEEYNAAVEKHDAAKKKMEETQKKIEEAKAKIASKQEHLATRAKTMYREGSVTMLDVLFGSNSFKEFVTLWDVMSDMNESDANLIVEIKDLKAELEVAYEEYSAAEKEAAEQLAKAEEAKKDLEKKAKAAQSYYDGLSAEMQRQIAAATESEYVNTSNGGSSDKYDTNVDIVDNGGYGPCDTGRALAQVGKPYVYGTAGPNSFDCSGLCYYCGAPARSSSALYAIAKSRVPVSQARPGDVLWSSGHVGISLGGNSYVHAEDERAGVTVRHNATSHFTYALRF
ncbi:MAG: C40 family peptidase [bacterium]|nr:C40 family peptidase [bacterium]